LGKTRDAFQDLVCASIQANGSGCTVCTSMYSGMDASSSLTLRKVVKLARGHDLLSDEHFTVDGTLLEAWAGQKRIGRKYGRIVNLSSGWGSFPEGMGGPGLYGVTKASLNALTIRLSKELPPAIKVNAMCPGWVRTRMGGQGATHSPDEGADTAVWLATLPDKGPTGGFFRDRKPIDW
jgi:NAD(P)-dependent dehydrogenase (short-subunit alcohol dehydrogenase family)